MSFGSVMKKVGKVALKVAPIAAAFIPGVGPLASMAIGAATNAADKKISGGSWKDAALSGGIGAAEGYGAGALKAASAGAKAASKAGGIAPSAGVATNAASKAGKLATVMNDVNKGLNIAGPVMGAIGAVRAGSSPSSGGIGPSTMPGNAPGFQYGTNNPNLADSINAGRQAGVRDQGFRAGYNITSPNPLNTSTTNLPPVITSRMPKITSDFAPIPRGNGLNNAGNGPLRTAILPSNLINPTPPSLFRGSDYYGKKRKPQVQPPDPSIY